MIINYNRNHSFIVLATVITIVNYDRKTFIVQATDKEKKGFIKFSPGDSRAEGAEGAGEDHAAQAGSP